MDDYRATPLHKAAGFNLNPAITQALIDAGANIHSKDNDGKTPLDLAERSNSSAVIRVLKEAEAKAK